MNQRPLSTDFNSSLNTPSKAIVEAFFSAAELGKDAVLQEALALYPVLAQWKEPNVQATALIVAARQGNAGAVQVLLEAGADIWVEDAGQMNAICAAAYNGHFDACLALIKAGADPSRASGNGMTAISGATAGDFPSLSGWLESSAQEHRDAITAAWDKRSYDVGTAKPLQAMKPLSLKPKT